MIQSVKPYVSSEDIAKGARWSTEIAKQLQTSYFGIICVTKENANSPWINFEAGALSREIESASVTPFLFNVPTSHLTGPLAQFQSVVNTKDDVCKLVESVNARQEAEHRLDTGALRKGFDKWWQELAAELEKIAKEESAAPATPKRDLQAMVEELVNSSRLQYRDADVTRHEQSVAFESLAARINQQNELLAARMSQQNDSLRSVVAALASSIDALRGETASIKGLEVVSQGIARLREFADAASKRSSSPSGTQSSASPAPTAPSAASLAAPLTAVHAAIKTSESKKK